MLKYTDYVSTLFDDHSNPNKITVAFKMGVQALKKGHSATVMLMVDGVYLARENALEGIDIGAPFEPAKALLEAFLADGGQVVVCSACMQHNSVHKEEIDSRFVVITADDVIDLLMNAKGSLQLT
ncbi:DsrE family protein [Suttonella sp. R2A3]|uniref:DsrE family protein n=1 Tax=Suttonella sp. R2A3 TaxID=2908648 RepID=UPI001F1D2077|nr:DsrE family protein [Suttonella sp. R2A3]UJF24111.1 DsrE family protein [Suttonella sp. R2A3]